MGIVGIRSLYLGNKHVLVAMFDLVYHPGKLGLFLCQLTCQSADIMSSLCGVGVRLRVCVRVRVNNFFSKTTRPRDMLFF